MIKKLLLAKAFVAFAVFSFAQTVNVTFEVNAANITPDAKGLHIAGGGTYGNPGDNPMSDSDNDGIWTVTISIAQGTSSYWTILNGGDDWNQKEDISGLPCANPDNYNDRWHAKITQDTTIKTCFAQCSTDGSCAAPPAEKEVTLSVNMKDVTEAFTTVYVSGDFNGWSGDANALSDDDADGIWTGTITTTKDSIEYKFQADGWAIQENLTEGDACTKTTGAFTNRFLVVSENVEVPAVCWGVCDLCLGGYDITFQVDMAGYEGDFTNVNFNGTINGWCGECTPMTDDDMDGIYTVTVNFPDTGETDWKFTVDGWTDQESWGTEGNPECTKVYDGQFVNRVMNVQMSDTLPVVCWNECVSCDMVPVDVTFQVDMNAFEGDSYTSVNLNGSFNGWCGECTPMTDADEDGVYDVTVALVPGMTYEYKFTLDGWAQQEEFTEGDECTSTIDGFTNRTYTVADGGATLDVVCYNSCEACPTGFGEINGNTFSVSPNPSTGFFNLTFDNEIDGDVVIYNYQGKVVYQNLSNTLTQSIDLSNEPAGIYLIKVMNGNSVGFSQIIIE
jgi:hypothetical protein